MDDVILIAEDDDKISNVLADYLRSAGFTTHCVNDGREVAPWVKKNTPGLILLDIMLPGTNGFDICSTIRSFSAAPVIMITARTEEADRLMGLGLGADDYICKPFSASEVVARVKAVLRRVKGQSDIVKSALTMNKEFYSANLYGHKLTLTPVEFKLLHILSRHPGRVYSRSQLLDMIFPGEHSVCDRTIDNHVKNMRKKLQTATTDQPIIHSIYGVGYKFELE